MTPEQNFTLIEEMLQNAKKEFAMEGKIYLVWGWLVFIASAFHFISLYFLNEERGGAVWMILMPLGGIYSFYYNRQTAKTQKVKTWFDDVMKFLWMSFGITIILSIIYMLYKQINALPFILSLYGLGLFMTGSLLKFNPLRYGGIICWITSFISIFIEDIYQLPLIALSVLLGYIIPGYLLQKRNV